MQLEVSTSMKTRAPPLADSNPISSLRVAALARLLQYSAQTTVPVVKPPATALILSTYATRLLIVQAAATQLAPALGVVLCSL
jgi:hypothetical protein